MDKNILASLKKWSGHKTSPILNTLKFEYGTVTATNLEVKVVHQLDDSIRVLGQGCIDANDFLKLAARFDRLTIGIHEDKAIIDAGSRSITLPAEPLDKFPVIDTHDDTFYGRFEVDKGFKNLKGFLSKDDLRPAMTGVHFGKAGKYAVTDASHLIWNRHNLNDNLPERGLIIPKDVFDLPISEYRVYTSKEAIYTTFDDGSTRYSFRNIDASYPQWEAVIPDNPFTVNLDKKELIGMLEDVIAIMPFNDGNSDFAFKVNPIQYSGNWLAWKHKESRKEFEANLKLVESDYDGKWAFNAVAMLEICKKLIPVNENEVSIRLHHAQRAGIINGNILLMPLKLYQDDSND